MAAVKKACVKRVKMFLIFFLVQMMEYFFIQMVGGVFQDSGNIFKRADCRFPGKCQVDGMQLFFLKRTTTKWIFGNKLDLNQGLSAPLSLLYLCFWKALMCLQPTTDTAGDYPKPLETENLKIDFCFM